MTSPFVVPVKHIDQLHADVTLFERSPACQELVRFITALSVAVRGMPVSSTPSPSSAVTALVNMLKEIDTWVDGIPPLPSAQRYGNKAFRIWSDKLLQESPRLLKDLLPESLHGSIVELGPYLAASFGDSTRIDYGTGHELSFVAFLYCLMKIGFFTMDDSSNLVLTIFRLYLDVMRRVQSIYFLEPAGSKGVWGLDDYQFLPFYWGSSQLIGNNLIPPAAIISESTISESSDDYLYLACIKFINKMKRGNFAEHSPLLWDISGVASWEKVNTGLLRMYHKEVLSKYPVVQHFLFGKLLTFDPVDTAQQ